MSLDPLSRMLIERQCTSVIHRIAHFQDQQDFDALANLYTRDAVYNSDLGTVFRGRDEIRARYGAGIPGLTTRHVITNILFLNVAADRADAIVYNMDLFTTGQEGENPFVDAWLVELHDHFERTDEGWLIARCDPKLVFAPADWQQRAQALMSRRRN